MATTIITKFGSGAPTASDVVRGELAVDTENKRLYTEDSGGSVVELGTNPAANVTFGDNGKAIFGAGSDLQIYHDGSDSIIYEGGTGALDLRSNSETFIKNGGGTETLAHFANNGAVTLYYDNSPKLATTSTGIDVTGTVTADGLTVDGNATIGQTSASDRTLSIGSAGATHFDVTTAGATGIVTLNATNDSTAGKINLQTADTDRLLISNNGDISFYEDTGTTAKFFWDASAESLGIGTTSPSDTLEVKASGDDDGIRLQGSGGANIAWLHQQSTDAATLRMYDGSDLNVLISSNANANSYFNTGGNVGIGTTSPAAIVHSKGEGTQFLAEDTSSGNKGGILVANTAMVIEADPDNSIASSHMQFKVDGSEAMRIDSSGNVGIGTDSPSDYSFNSGVDLVVGDGNNNAISIVSSTSGLGYLAFADGTTGTERYQGLIEYSHASNYMALRTGGSEAMRIDSSGNLLVGKTSAAGYSTAGIELRGGSDNYATITKDGGTTLYLNRLTSDGEIVNFRKNGTTVGSIATRASAVTTLILDPRTPSSTTGAGFGTTAAALVPADTSGLTDAKNDLGASDNRFKDLYLSSSVDLRTDGSTSVDFTDTDTAPGAGKLIGEITWTDSHSSYGNTGINLEGQYTAAGMHSFVIKTNDFSTPANLETRLVVNNSGFQIYDGAGSEAARFDGSGNLLVGTTTTPSSSAGNLVLANGTAPTGSASNGVVLYAEDVSSSSELKVRDEAGNVTTLSPHNFDLIPQGPSEDMAWSYYSERDGKSINVDMLKAIRVLEKLSGEQLVFEN